MLHFYANLAFCVLVYLPLHAQFASVEGKGVWGAGGEREPFGTAINVAAKWQCHARLGPLCLTAKTPPNEDFRLKGCVPYPLRQRRRRRHGVALARRSEVRLSP